MKNEKACIYCLVYIFIGLLTYSEGEKGAIKARCALGYKVNREQHGGDRGRREIYNEGVE